MCPICFRFAKKCQKREFLPVLLKITKPRLRHDIRPEKSQCPPGPRHTDPGTHSVGGGRGQFGARPHHCCGSRRERAIPKGSEFEREAARAATTKAALALAKAENDLLRQRILDLETALAGWESALRSAHAKADCEVACLKKQNKELQSQLHQTWRRYNNDITRSGLTFKASSLIAKALHPDAMSNEEVRLQAFKEFSAWMKSDRDAARRR
jgi:hypothetical protein